MQLNNEQIKAYTEQKDEIKDSPSKMAESPNKMSMNLNP